MVLKNYLPALVVSTQYKVNALSPLLDWYFEIEPNWVQCVAKYKELLAGVAWYARVHPRGDIL